MKKVNIKFFVISLLIVIVFFVYYGITLRNNSIIEKANKQEKSLISEKKYKSLKITDINNDDNHLTATLLNIQNFIFESEDVDIVFLNRTGDVLCEDTITLPKLRESETERINIALDQKCRNAYTFVLKEKKEDYSNE